MLCHRQEKFCTGNREEPQLDDHETIMLRSGNTPRFLASDMYKYV